MVVNTSLWSELEHKQWPEELWKVKLFVESLSASAPVQCRAFQRRRTGRESI